MQDTSSEAERILIDVYRWMSPQDKWRQWISSCHTARQLHAAGVRLLNPRATPAEIHRDWIARTLGRELADLKGEAAMETPAENLDVLQQVVTAFADLGIPYALGGSLASSLLGKPRFTQDGDVSVLPFAGKEEAWISRFGPDFYVSLAAVQEAIRQRSSFNIIHLPTGFKVDVFICKDRPFDASFMARRQAAPLPDRPGQVMTVVSAEDIILLKLEWYRLGGEVSERQWSDVLGVMEIQGARLDQAYLDRWASALNVGDLLERVRSEAKTS
jgi:hypothetical protein